MDAPGGPRDGRSTATWPYNKPRQSDGAERPDPQTPPRRAAARRRSVFRSIATYLLPDVSRKLVGLVQVIENIGGRRGIRTPDPLIKSRFI